MDSLKRGNVRLFAVLIGGSAAVGALSVVPRVGRQVVKHDRRLDKHRDDALDCRSHDDGGTGDAGSRGAARRGTGARRAVTNRISISEVHADGART